MSRLGSDIGQVVGIVGGFMVVMSAIGLYFMEQGRMTETDRAADVVKLFFNTVDQGLPKNSWMALHSSTRKDFPLERFEALIESHHAFGPVVEFELDVEQADANERVWTGALHRETNTIPVTAVLEDEDGALRIVDIQTGGRSLFSGGSASLSTLGEAGTMN